MKSSILASMKAIGLVTTAAGVLFSVAAWAADYPGYIKVENFDAINGGNITDLTAAAKYTNNLPDSVTFVDSLYYSRTPGADNYGSRISGFLTPTETAEYVFLVAADDSTSFYLSTDSSPANQKLIAADQGWQNSRTWTGPGGASSGAGTTAAVFRRGFNPGAAVMATNNFEWVGPFENRSDQFLISARANLVGAATNRWPTTNASGNAVINLTANQSYYFELLFKEGSGGENAGVTWKKAGDPDPANNDPEIPGAFLHVIHTNGLSFLVAPQSQSLLLGQTAIFTANAVGIPGDSDYTQFTYQWLVNGQPITDGTGVTPTYTVPSVTFSDSGKKYSVRVTTALGLTGTSPEAILTVSSDNVSPKIDKVTGKESFDAAFVKYSEPVNDAAADFNNYKLSGGVTITAAQFVVFDQNDPSATTNRTKVRLTTSKQTEGAQLTLTVSNVKDLAGNVLAPNTAAFSTFIFETGILSHKIWLGQGTSISTLTNNADAYDSPSIVDTRNNAEQGLNNAQNEGVPSQNYLSDLEGFFIPAVTTNYVFFFCADNDGYMYLSTDESPANKKLIAADVGWQNVRTWTGPGGDTAKRRGDGAGGGPFENRSDELLTSPRVLNGVGALSGFVPADGVDPDPWPDVDASGNVVISLTAGKRYYMELWHVEFEGGAVQATMKIAGTPDPTNGTPSTLTGNLIGAIVDPALVVTGGPTISVSRNASGAPVITYTGTLESATSVSGGTWATVPGATSPYTSPTTDPMRFFRSKQ